MPQVYTVSQVSAYLKNLFARDYALSRISIKGEVSNCKYHSSGHIYFTLKDEAAQLKCVMFARERNGLSFGMTDGQKIEAEGQIAVYEKTGSYQLYVRACRLQGEGELFERFLKLKTELEEMGMFDSLYKKPIPPYCQNIGIVTAETGAAIHDIMNISYRRNPYVRLVLCPARVQGAGAAESIANGIRRLDAMGLDVIIAGRGGGSIEDLWAFNEEIVAKAIFNARTPIISAVGHETDTTIADYVADLRAPTPSAAAEIAVFDHAKFEEELSSVKTMLKSSLLRRTENMSLRLEALRHALLKHEPALALEAKNARLSEIKKSLGRILDNRTENKLNAVERSKERLKENMRYSLERSLNRLENAAVRLDSLSPLKKMGGGYSYLADKNGRGILSVNDIEAGERFTAYLTDGKLEAEIIKKEDMKYGSR